MSSSSQPAVHPFEKRSTPARRRQTAFFWVFRLLTYAIIAFSAWIFLDIIWKGAPTVFQKEFPFVNISFLTEFPETLHVFTDESGKELQLGEKDFRAWEREHSPDAVATHKTYVYSAGGIMPCIVGTFVLVSGCVVIAMFLGVAAAIYLSEYSRGGRFMDWVRLAILNLSGVPSIVFGLFGFALFVLVAPIITAHPQADAAFAIPLWIGGLYLSFQGWEVSMLSGWFTLAFMILPVIITASEESLRAVPQGFREGSLALGATKWKSIRTNVLPYAFPGILTSSVLGITRVAGETAPIMFTAAYVVRDRLPWEGLKNATEFFFQGVMALPYHIYVLAAKIPNSAHTQRVQYGTVFVFLVIVTTLAITSVVLRAKVRKMYKW